MPATLAQIPRMRSRDRVSALMFLLSAMSPLFAQVPEVFLHQEQNWQEEEEPEWVKDTKATLEKRISFDFVDTPIHDVIAFLQNLTGKNMVLDPASLGREPVRVTLKVQEMRLSAALDWILRLTNLAYAFKDEAIYIASPEKVFGPSHLCIYDVREIVGLNTPEEGKETKPELPGAIGMTPEELVTFLRGSVMPESWNREGARIICVKGLLSVFHGEEVHEHMRAALRQLVETRSKSISAEIAVGKANREVWAKFEALLRQPPEAASQVGLPVFLPPELAAEAFAMLQPVKVSLSGLAGQDMHSFITEEVQAQATGNPSEDGCWATLTFRLFGKLRPEAANPVELSSTVRLPHGIPCLVAKRENPGDGGIEFVFITCSVTSPSERLEQLRSRYQH